MQQDAQRGVATRDYHIFASFDTRQQLRELNLGLIDTDTSHRSFAMTQTIRLIMQPGTLLRQSHSIGMIHDTQKILSVFGSEIDRFGHVRQRA